MEALLNVHIQNKLNKKRKRRWFCFIVLSGWASARGLLSVRFGHWWCHAPWYLGPGKVFSSLTLGLEPPSWRVTYSAHFPADLHLGWQWSQWSREEGCSKNRFVLFSLNPSKMLIKVQHRPQCLVLKAHFSSAHTGFRKYKDSKVCVCLQRKQCQLSSV